MKRNILVAFLSGSLLLAILVLANPDTLFNRIPSACQDSDANCVVANIQIQDNVNESLNLRTANNYLNASQFNSTIPTGSTIVNISVHVRWGDVPTGRGADRQNISIWNTTHWFRCAGPFGDSAAWVDTICFFSGSNLTGNFTTLGSVNDMAVNFTGYDPGGSTALAYIDIINITIYYMPPPSSPSFTIAFPVSYSGSFNESINSACTSENACPTVNNITFNFTGMYQNFTEPMTNGQTANQQASSSKPIFLIYNTGNVNEQIGINTSTPTGFYTCANSTCVGGECSGTVSTCTNISSPGYLNLGTVNQGKRMNITLYANVTYAIAGTYQTYTYVNATG